MTPKQLARFEAKVERVTESGCWIWLGNVLNTGYGQVSLGGRMYQAHRAAYEHHRGPIPPGLHTDHLCRVRSCVNPWHLEPVTCRENILRGTGYTAKSNRKTHCPRGHALEGANLHPYYAARGRRACLTCVRVRALAGYHRRRAIA